MDGFTCTSSWWLSWYSNISRLSSRESVEIRQRNIRAGKERRRVRFDSAETGGSETTIPCRRFSTMKGSLVRVELLHATLSGQASSVAGIDSFPAAAAGPATEMNGSGAVTTGEHSRLGWSATEGLKVSLLMRLEADENQCAPLITTGKSGESAAVQVIGMWDSMRPAGGEGSGLGGTGSPNHGDASATAIARRSVLGTRVKEAADQIRAALMHGWTQDIHKVRPAVHQVCI